jgi:hypothetical protein
MALGLNDFNGGKSTTPAIGRGGPQKSRLSWAKKSFNFQGPLLPEALEMDLLPSKSLRPTKLDIFGPTILSKLSSTNENLSCQLWKEFSKNMKYF